MNTMNTERAPKCRSILLIYESVYPEAIGGVEHRNHEIAKALAEKGHKVTIAGWRLQSPAREGQVNGLKLRFATPVYTSDGKRSLRASMLYALACSLLPVGRYDVIETANIPYLHLIPLSIRCLIARRKLIVTWHEYWGKYWRRYVGRLRAPLFSLIERLSVQLGSTVIAVSHLTAARVRASRIGASDVPIVPCGVDLPRIQSAIAGTARRKNELIYAGRLTTDKGLALVIHAIACLKHGGTTVRLRVVGEGPERAALEKLSAELNLTDEIEFVGRLESSEEVWRALSECRIAVTASLREGFGMFPLEAMACGTPVVFCESSESALPEIVGNGRCGLMASPTAESIAAEVRKLVYDDALWGEFHKNAIAQAKVYRWKAIAEQLETIIYSTL